MKFLVPVALVVVGVIHLLPLTGVAGRGQLLSLYGTDISDPNLLILMRHRAVLFGILGAFMLFAAFAQPYQSVALILGTVSVVSFLWVAYVTGGYNAQVGRVVTADLIALAFLVIASVAHGKAHLSA